MNRNLGNYDMVLALSINRINYHFSKLYKKKIIHNDWCFLTNSTGEEMKFLSAEEMNGFWHSKEQIGIKKAEKNRLQEKYFDTEDENEREKLNGLIDKLRNEIKTLEQNGKDTEKYDLGMNAKIDKPQIYAINGKPKELIFQIEISSGKIFFIKDSKRQEYDLNGLKYAFVVSIGHVEINSDKKVLVEDGDQYKTITLEEKGISNDDFTIESLFLDFENANISQYDKSHSQLTDDLEINGSLQVALQNFFNHVKSEENPYILGYGISKKKIPTEAEKPILYPTGVKYSTSYSSQKDEKKRDRASAFNFLMLLNNHPFPSTQDAGVLPHSIIEYAQDKTATVNAVFGINYRDFEENYIKKIPGILAPQIEEMLNERLRDPCNFRASNMDIKGSFSNSNVPTGKEDKTASYKGNLKFIYEHLEDSDRGISLIYRVECDGKIYVTDRDSYFGIGGEAGSITMRWPFSTHGHAKNTKGRPGQFKIWLGADTNGKLKMEPKYESHIKVGLDTEEGVIDSASGTYKNIPGLNLFMWLINMLLDTIFQNEISNALKALDSIEGLDDQIGLVNLTQMEKRVVLPVSTSYLYKNLRLFNAGNPDNEVLLLDATYGVQA
jgi:hypothetical protein